MKMKKISDALFYIGLTIELLIVLIDKSALHNPLEGQLFRITFLLFILKVCFTKYSFKEWLWTGGFGILGGIVYLSTGENVILRVVAFAAAMKGMELKAVIRYVFWVTLAGCLLIVALAFAGILGELSNTQAYRMDGNETRYCFGMGHPNAFHCMILMLVLLFVYLYQEKLNILILMALFAGNLGLYYFTGSKTGFGMTAMAVAVVFVLYKGVRLRKSVWVYLLGAAVVIGCVAVSVWAAGNSINAWADPVLSKIDTLLSGRMINLYWDSEVHAGALETWTWFSEPLHLEYYFDMGWVRMFYWFGIIPGFIFTLLHVLLVGECYRKKDYMGLVLIVILSVYTIVEAHIISVYMARNYILLFFGAYWRDMFRIEDNKEADRLI